MRAAERAADASAAGGEGGRREHREGGGELVGPADGRGAAACAGRREGGRGMAVRLGRQPAVGQERSGDARGPARGCQRERVGGAHQSMGGRERNGGARRTGGEGGRREGGRGAAAHRPLCPCRSAHRPLPLHFTPLPLGSASSRHQPPTVTPSTTGRRAAPPVAPSTPPLTLLSWQCTILPPPAAAQTEAEIARGWMPWISTPSPTSRLDLRR